MRETNEEREFVCKMKHLILISRAVLVDTAQSSMHLLASSTRSIFFAFRLRVYRFQSFFSFSFIPIFHFIYELFWLFGNSLA